MKKAGSSPRSLPATRTVAQTDLLQAYLSEVKAFAGGGEALAERYVDNGIRSLHSADLTRISSREQLAFQYHRQWSNVST